MLSKEDQDHIKRVKKTAYLLNLPEEVIELTLHYTSEYIKSKIAEVRVSNEEPLLTEEEFLKLFPVIKLNPLGYLRPNYYKYKSMYNKYQQRKKIKEEQLNGK